MVKTEFSVMDVKTGSTEKAVLHTYKSKTFFMIQGNAVMADKTYCKDFFFEKVMKLFIKNIMLTKGKEIEFLNQFLKTKVLPLSTWKRKQPLKSNRCDVCSRIFVNQNGVNIHKVKMHGDSSSRQQKKIKSLKPVKVEEYLTKSNSVSSISYLSPPPKKIILLNKPYIKEKKSEAKDSKGNIEEIEYSGLERNRDSDQKVNVSVQCTIVSETT